MLRSDLLEHFKKFDTPTICNALELIDSRFRLHGFTTEQMVCADPSLPPIVGMHELPPSGLCPRLIQRKNVKSEWPITNTLLPGKVRTSV